MATSDPSGPLIVTGYGPNPLATVITRVDLSGKVEWQRTYPGTGKPQSRLAMDGALWLAYPDRDGQLLEGVLPDGSTGPTARPECRADEEIGAFVFLDDGFVISWVSGSRVVRWAGARTHPASPGWSEEDREEVAVLRERERELAAVIVTHELWASVPAGRPAGRGADARPRRSQTRPRSPGHCRGGRGAGLSVPGSEAGAGGASTPPRIQV
ncbi:hypothetical protein AB0904_07055 [Streptomyces sp. NPDC006684]|uniref:hypothetical protein n=1 Tax=Streptomyces sp. NPDC006684 TaxID=3154477 RepID=UPI0034538386